MVAGWLGLTAAGVAPPSDYALSRQALNGVAAMEPEAVVLAKGGLMRRESRPEEARSSVLAPDGVVTVEEHIRSGREALGEALLEQSGGLVRKFVVEFLEENRHRALLVGTALQLTACFSSACGLVMQRFSLSIGCGCLWRSTGILLCLASIVPDAVSYLLAPQCLLSQVACLEPLLVAALALALLPTDAASISWTQVVMIVTNVVGALGCAAAAPTGSVLLMGPEAEEGAFEGRLVVYLGVVFPVLLLMRWQERREASSEEVSWCTGLWLPTLAGTSLALQRLCMVALGVALKARQPLLNVAGPGPGAWPRQPRDLLDEPRVSIIAAAFCLSSLSVLYHVWRGAREQPPHVFVPVYCTVTAAVQLLQSLAVLREYRDEPVEKAGVSVLACLVSLLGVAALLLEHGGYLAEELWKARVPPISRPRHVM